MHIPDGYLGPTTCGFFYVVMLPIWGLASRIVKKTLSAKQVPLLAIGAAFSFVIMMFNIPIPGGSNRRRRSEIQSSCGSPGWAIFPFPGLPSWRESTGAPTSDGNRTTRPTRKRCANWICRLWLSAAVWVTLCSNGVNAGTATVSDMFLLLSHAPSSSAHRQVSGRSLPPVLR